LQLQLHMLQKLLAMLPMLSSCAYKKYFRTTKKSLEHKDKDFH
jgi:hypothetical protein